MALGSTQPLTEMSAKCILGGKGDRCVRLTTLPPSCAVVTESGNLNFLEPYGPLQACTGLLYLITTSSYALCNLGEQTMTQRNNRLLYNDMLLLFDLYKKASVKFFSGTYLLT